jgi:hypothetical protein
VSDTPNIHESIADILNSALTDKPADVVGLVSSVLQSKARDAVLGTSSAAEPATSTDTDQETE